MTRFLRTAIASAVTALAGCSGSHEDGTRPDSVHDAMPQMAAPEAIGDTTTRKTTGRYGYIVLREGAVGFGLSGIDTLNEVPRSSIPKAIRRRGDSLAADSGMPVACNRFFGTGPHVLFSTHLCDLEVSETDSWGMVVIPDAQSPITNFQGLSTICPLTRDAVGRASERC